MKICDFKKNKFIYIYIIIILLIILYFIYLNICTNNKFENFNNNINNKKSNIYIFYHIYCNSNTYTIVNDQINKMVF
jgi:lysophospholipid acyltransferase (LPLAT)-like uncharacterized protein